MSSFERVRLDPVEQIKQRGWPAEHIAYDPKMRKGDYYIVRQSTHDGTLLFSLELMERALINLASKTSFYKPREKEFMANPSAVRYTVGPLRLSIVYGKVKLPCSETNRYSGQRERIRIPVRVHESSALNEGSPP